MPRSTRGGKSSASSARGGGASRSSRSSRPRGGEGGRASVDSSFASSRASSAIHHQKRAERRMAENERRASLGLEDERKASLEGEANGHSARVGFHAGTGVEGKDGAAGRGEVGIFQEYLDNPEAGDEEARARKLRALNADVSMMDVHRDQVGKRATADEELQGRSMWEMVDRGTLMVGCCLILVVIVAVTIPVVLISEDEPYVAPRGSDAPTFSPTPARMLEEGAILERLAKITPGGVDTLWDTETAHHRAFMWIVYEDGMELGAAKDHLHQRFVLMVIYFISGPWTPVEGRLEWGSPVHECEWEGIFCKDVEELEEELEGRIDELLVVGREDGIKIDVPQRVANRLELRQRLVSGEVPAEFSLLYYLQHLDLENNKLFGPLPTPLYKLFNLQTLFLEQNELTNVDAIGEYRHLERLSLSKNNFRGPLPESFRNLKKLKTLYLHTNGFTGSVFDILKDFTSMELLDLAFNEFEGTLPSEFGSMKNLTSVFIGHNYFQGTIPNEIGNCKNLKEFQIDGSHDIGGTIPSVFGQLAKLEFLKLDTCAFSGALPMSLGNLQNLRWLDVNSNDLEGRIPTQLGKATSLKTLALANNNFEGGVPKEFGRLKKLEQLHLQNTDLSGEMPKEVCDLRTQGNQTVLEVLWVPCDVECEVGAEECCTNCS